MTSPRRVKISRIQSFLFLISFVAPLFSYAQEIELRVMTFNIWYGGEQVSFQQTAEVIHAAHPDLIGVQEPDGNLRALAAAAGFSYVDEKRNIISRYPLFDPDSDQAVYPYTRVLVRPGAIVAIANVHLESTPFGPDLLRDGKSVREVLAVEKRIRLPQVDAYLRTLTPLIGQAIPVFFTGDFNSPSHQDDSRLEWPVTKALADAGFHDAYRTIFPDANAKRGLTFTPGYPHPYRKLDETLTRIDMIWTAGRISATECKIIGERNNRDVDIVVEPYPSDHRAVVSTFRVTPAPAPAMIAVDSRSVIEGSDFLVRFQTTDFADWGVVIVPHRGDIAHAVLSAVGPNLISTRPSFKFGSLGIAAGTYDAVLVDAKKKELARTTFYIIAKNALPELRVEKSEYKAGEAIKVFWRNAPGMKNDWIGIYRANDPEMYGGYIAYEYTGAKIEGSMSLDRDVLTKPLSPGKYELRLMREDSYVMLAKTQFSVIAE